MGAVGKIELVAASVYATDTLESAKLACHIKAVRQTQRHTSAALCAHSASRPFVNTNPRTGLAITRLGALFRRPASNVCTMVSAGALDGLSSSEQSEKLTWTREWRLSGF